MAARRTVMCASARAQGKSAQVARAALEALNQAHPSDQVDLINLFDFEIGACIGCNACRTQGRCFMRDGMDDVLALLDASSGLIVASPVFFAGPPSHYKAFLDRLQPHFWLGTRKRPKRPAFLVAAGDGGDPHGFDPLTVCSRSALACAGFRLLHTYACIDEDPSCVGQQAGSALAAIEGTVP